MWMTFSFMIRGHKDRDGCSEQVEVKRGSLQMNNNTSLRYSLAVVTTFERIRIRMDNKVKKVRTTNLPNDPPVHSSTHSNN
ncbi:hypothetical protein E2C01_046982 [Portunus trituberculatus]|uniref:Uncharacterized protein n=1 Tax=Portunus trituberculatus TaxID=210409 RepID=A0A5B7G6C0_PORTR|nr:hypothetical protein [Portunus trituberculatus]